MHEDETAVITVVRQWIQKAENDLKNASHTLKLGEDAPTDTICFHVQQCVEKYIKAYLVWCGIEFSRIHHISTLLELLPSDQRPELTVEEQEQLTDYAVTTRYPGAYEPIPLAEAQKAVIIAQRVREEMRSFLPEIILGISGESSDTKQSEDIP